MGYFQALAERKEREEQRKAQQQQMEYAARQNRENISLQDDTSYKALQQERSDLIRWQQDFNEDVERIRYNFLGWYYNENRQKVINKEIKPLCNELFFDQVVQPLVSSYLIRGYTNSFLTERFICASLRDTFNNLASTLITKREMYGIKTTNLSLITRMLKNYVKAPAYRAINGSTKKIDSTMIKRIESLQDKPEEKEKKGFFGIGG